MNELQQVLLVFAVVVIGGLYFFSKTRQKKSPPSDRKEATSKTSTPNPKNSHSSTNASVEDTSHDHANVQSMDETDKNQGKLVFGDDFDPPQQVEQEAAQPQIDSAQFDQVDQTEAEVKTTATHHVLEVEELFTISEVGPSVEDLPKPNFGIPEDNKPAAMQTPSNVERERQIFALMVLNTGSSGQDFKMDVVNQSLLGVGTTLSKNQIYVTTDPQGTEIIRVANIMEPGTFPTENLPSHTTPGLVLILELPTSVKAPRAMHDLIMMARKVSQRLNGRLYNMERQLIKESDLQAMRDAAVHYESEPI